MSEWDWLLELVGLTPSEPLRCDCGGIAEGTSGLLWCYSCGYSATVGDILRSASACGEP
jgi:hypothetical protein